MACAQACEMNEIRHKPPSPRREPAPAKGRIQDYLKLFIEIGDPDKITAASGLGTKCEMCFTRCDEAKLEGSSAATDDDIVYNSSANPINHYSRRNRSPVEVTRFLLDHLDMLHRNRRLLHR